MKNIINKKYMAIAVLFATNLTCGQGESSKPKNEDTRSSESNISNYRNVFENDPDFKRLKLF